MHVEQAIYGCHAGGGYRFLARSPGFHDEWLPEAEQICVGFGERPSGTRCPRAVYAQPLGKERVAVVQVADQGTDDSGRPGALAFHLLVLSRDAYLRTGPDPFALAERLPPDWNARDSLPTLEVNEMFPRRSVTAIRAILERADGAAILAAAQVLADGGRLVLERDQPAQDFIPAVWRLLPTSIQSELWPATFAFDNTLAFGFLAIPRVPADALPGFLREDQLDDYPIGRFEERLRLAIADDDQAELDSVLNRRSPRQTLRLGLILAAALALVATLSALVQPPPQLPPPTPTRRALTLPEPSAYPILTDNERASLAAALHDFAEALAVDVPDSADPNEVLIELWRHAPQTEAARTARHHADSGPPLRQFHALLWLHGLDNPAQPGLAPGELVERFRQAR
jgi:hypothetical protein